ncbi:NFX1-type zinc finger-containing protein 1-like [Thrips palmi]|uniref:NFX1-type zinc finger-containing protein 1-like n=1 Tax=Thrips palmi TaxID=161013 RepID=A0A6P8ZUG1_THRPL|nr:NFX1-type zinc finger-containing protein 1-like [Thrips palmi]
MNSQTLLQDLHFDLGSSDSAYVSKPKRSVSKERTFLYEFVDRSLRTAKWVANLHSRQRSLSTDSYFGSESVCDKLKKSFLKPRTVTEEELEDLRSKLAEIKIKDSEFCLEDPKLKCTQGKILHADDSNVTEGDICFISEHNRPVMQRFRSKTVPLFSFNNEAKNGCVCESSDKNDKQTDELGISSIQIIKLKQELFTCNNAPVQPLDEGCSESEPKDAVNEQICQDAALASIQSVDLIKDLCLDENRNLIASADLERQEECNSKVESLSHNFRCESVFPNQSELKGPRKPFDLRPNKLIGLYENEEDYLKTHFYLLKEDFIGPLKEGINEYRRQLRRGNAPVDVRNLKLHHNVLVVEPHIKEDRLGLVIDMGFPLSEKIGDKDFMDGSLVLITPNHFKDIFVGTVFSRKFVSPSGQRETRNPGKNNRRPSNILMVQLHGTSHFDPALKHRRVLLAESQTFFQPYYYVMKIFQGMTHDDLPLKEYILGSRSNGGVECPSYLLTDTEYTLEDNFRVKVMSDASWPDAQVLDVNDSQLNALKRALSEKLVLIQGPPGTGKTYLGCKVAKALLQNKHVWNKGGNQPLLLMCQTNHALDQFMELLLPMSRNVIRIGCQSKSVLLAPFNIREWLRRRRSKAGKQSAVVDLKKDLKTLSTNIQVCQIELKRVASYGIVDFQTLVTMGAMDLKSASCFINSENYLMWLEGAKSDQASFVSDDQLAQEGNTGKSTDCLVHKKMPPTSLESQGLNTYSNFPSSLNEEASSSAMKNIHIKYLISLYDNENTVKEQPSNTSAEPDRKLLEARIRFFKHCLSESSEDSHVTVKCLWTVAPNNRWGLYRSWIKNLENVLQSHLQLLETHYLSSSSAYADLKQFEKLEVMRQAEIVGMTTSAAARLYPVLCELHCPIALVEEAAEVHETHIVATITKHCQHLILLGDHKQLRPRPASYALSRTHFTDVSLFERLLLNKTVTVNTLLTQHRMQPQISALIRPSIYAQLYDHMCTRNRQNILGIKKNVFFFSHRWQEKKNLLTGSYSNPEEAKMAVQLVRYLLREEYNSDDICILAAYREQVNELESNCNMYPELTGIRCLTVDNFQGEESKIVILSLVRNNSENQIGFLKIENRVCVALSRARDGLFMLGNVQLLSSNSELWMSVHKVLKLNSMVGQSIPLSCSRHPQKQRNVCKPDDIPKYVCRQTCSFKLACGHLCRRKCHPNDSLHLKFRCEEPCDKTCAFGHRCNKLCFEECGECECMDWKHLACGHWAVMRCSVEPSKYLCEVTVKKLMHPCSHSVNLQCWMPSVSHKYCPNQCPVSLKCGHKCPVRCNAVKHPNHEVSCCTYEDKPRILSSKTKKHGKSHNSR